jgi:hypothetical protein
MRTRASSRLRLERQPHPLTDARAERVFRQAVAHEMLLARETARERDFDPNDARWRLATETQRALQGAVLAYEDRRQLLALANRLGIRAFDANLILAVVQDRARRGEPLESAAPTVAMVPKPVARSATRPVASPDAPSPEAPSVARPVARPVARVWTFPQIESAWLWVGAVMLAMVADAALIAWLIFG